MPNKGAIITGIVSLAAMAAIGATFIANASPYVDVDGALRSKGDNMHLAGKILKPSLHADYAARTISFTVEDANGKTLPVQYNGEAIANIGEADRVVAIGGVKGGVFHSTKLLIKCPSKYGDNKSGASMNSGTPSPSNGKGANAYEGTARKGI
jgi:cytochrome c-type biogenesis protein CcmE